MNTISLVRLSSTPDDILTLQRTLERAPDYSIEVTGRAVAPEAAAALMTELPPGRTMVDKFVFSLVSGQEVVGCADVLRGYPVPGTAFIGLLLICQDLQARGMGAAACDELESLCRSWGCGTLRLAAVETNAGALRFWEKLGFARTGERREYRCGEVESHLVLMEKSVAT